MKKLFGLGKSKKKKIPPRRSSGGGNDDDSSPHEEAEVDMPGIFIFGDNVNT